MTEKLYLDNSLLLNFESVVVKVQESDNGFEVILQSSAFYPESGGQLYDTGMLDGNRVINVLENEAGEVVHVVDSWGGSASETVEGVIDRERRLDNMRKHTGQHILSGAFVECVGADTVSAHLGEVESTIELSVPSLDEKAIRETEILANRIILENHDVKINYYNRSELDNLPVRKIPELEGKYRIIQIGEFDYTACGGTHCRQSGEVGLIKIVAQEKMRNHLRVSFLTGRQALDDYHAKHMVATELSNKLTCHFSDLNRAVDKLFDQNAAMRKEIGALNKALLPYEIGRLRENAVDIGGVKIIVECYDNKNPKELKELAVEISQSFNSISLLSADDRLVIAVSADVPTEARKLADLVTQRFGGRGGGSSTFAQIGGIPADKRQEILDGFVEAVKTEIGG